MMRVLFLITGLNHAGAENQLLQLCRGFRAKGFSISVVSMVEPAAYVDELGELGIEVHSLNMSKGFPDPRAIMKLRRVIKQFQPDVIHSHLVHANILARVTRLFVKMPLLICTAHSINEGGQIREWLYRITDPLCELTTNVSEKAVERYIEDKIAPKHKIRFIPNGIDISQFDRDRELERSEICKEIGIDPDCFIWFAAGRMVPEKDYPNMIQAFSQVSNQYPKCKLLIAGMGPLREMLEQRCAELGVANQVHFLGIRKDIPRVMNAADAYVMSSQWEGMPIVLLEASASGLPIVATDVGGNREVVRNGTTGFLVPAENSNELGKQMINMMCTDPATRRQMGQAARQFVQERYSLNAVIEQWTDIYAGSLHGQEVLT